MFHKVQSVAAQKDFILLVTFAEGISKKYDVTPLFERIPVFCELRDTPNLFEQVVVDVGGYGISWNDDIDLACDELWANGVVVRQRFILFVYQFPAEGLRLHRYRHPYQAKHHN